MLVSDATIFFKIIAVSTQRLVNAGVVMDIATAISINFI